MRAFLAAAGLACALSWADARATTVLVMALEQDRAQLLVNGTAIRQLRGGQSSPEGVRLVSANRNEAVVEVEGRTLVLRLGQSTVATTELRADARGQFLTAAFVNGVETRALIDTGATTVALNREEAQRMGVDLRRAPRVEMSTAGGVRTGYRVTLASVRVGAIAITNVEAVVTEGGREQLPLTLIGMSFLNGVDLRRSGDTLTLTRRNF